MLFFVFLVMLYAATGKKFYLVGGFLVTGRRGVPWEPFFVFGHVQARVSQSGSTPSPTRSGQGLPDRSKALYSIADGDLFGVGIGRGLCRRHIPCVESDFVFAAIAEEAGLLGAAGVLLLYLSFAIRGYVTAARAKSDVQLASSPRACTAAVVLQAFIIVGGVTRLIPLTGLTLPFISQGGSSLLASFIAVGLLLRCGRRGHGRGRGDWPAAAPRLRHQQRAGTRVAGQAPDHAMLLFSILFVLLVANLTLIMVVQAKDYQNMPGNNHTIAKQAQSEARHASSTYDGTVLAESVPTRRRLLRADLSRRAT